MKRFIILAISAILFTSCEKEIEFKGEQTDPKLVVNSLIEPGQPVKAAISKSYFFLDNEANTMVPDDLVATLYVNGNRLGEMTPSYDTIVSYYIWDPNNTNLGHVRKVYTHDYCPLEGDVVKITASAHGFDDVETVTSPLPNAVEVQLIAKVAYWDAWYEQIYNYESQEEEEDSLLRMVARITLTLDITDPNPGQSDYFKVYIEKRKTDYPSKNTYDCSFEYDDPIFSSALPDNDFIDMSDLDLRPEGVFTDVLFDGKSYQLKFDMHVWMTLDEEYNPEFFQLPIRLEHLSKEYYYYLNTCDQGDEVAFQIYAEPIQTYTNVNGGYGIVAGRTAETLWYALPLSE